MNKIAKTAFVKGSKYALAAYAGYEAADLLANKETHKQMPTQIDQGIIPAITANESNWSLVVIIIAVLIFIAIISFITAYTVRSIKKDRKKTQAAVQPNAV